MTSGTVVDSREGGGDRFPFCSGHVASQLPRKAKLHSDAERNMNAGSLASHDYVSQIATRAQPERRTSCRHRNESIGIAHSTTRPRRPVAAGAAFSTRLLIHRG